MHRLKGWPRIPRGRRWLQILVGALCLAVLLHLLGIYGALSHYGSLNQSHVCKILLNSKFDALSSPYNLDISNATTVGGVPMILHFVYRDTSILDDYHISMETCSRLNSNWKIMLWTDDSVRQFMSREYPNFTSVFYSFRHKIQRSDAIRYLILYRVGGVYMDLDMTCRQPLVASISAFSCFLDREREHQTQVLHGRRYSAMNSAMGCQPGHPFFKRVIDFVFHPDRLKGAFSFPQTIFDTTGPGMLNSLYNEWHKTAPDVQLLGETYFSPKVNPRSGLYATCRQVVQSLGTRRTGLSMKEAACVDVHRLGYEKSDATFITNLTVAVHEFTHLGYHDQSSTRFDALTKFPQLLQYTNICWLQ